VKLKVDVVGVAVERSKLVYPETFSYFIIRMLM